MSTEDEISKLADTLKDQIVGEATSALKEITEGDKEFFGDIAKRFAKAYYKKKMGDDADKCFTMAIILNFLYEYRQAQHEVAGSPESPGLQHLAIFEEAHRILRAAPHGAGRDANPQAKMGEMFADILAEIRAYGQGLGIIDQVPSKLVPDALKNTNLKIVHRLVSADDRDAMASALALEEDQPQIIARLKVGQTIISGIQDDMASWVKVFYSPLPEFKKKE